VKPPPEAKPPDEAPKDAVAKVEEPKPAAAVDAGVVLVDDASTYRWPCNKIAKLSPIYDYTKVHGPWRMFQINFDGGGTLMIAIEGTDKDDRAALAKMHKTIKACRGSGRTIRAANTKGLVIPWVMDSGHIMTGGVRVDVSRVMLLD
jgi:hypothetical protein